MGAVYWGVHGALNKLAAPTLMGVGDSWLFYPIHNLAQAIQSGFHHQDFVMVGKSGQEAKAWVDDARKDIDFAFKMYGSSVKGLLLSGGGNDIAGMKDFLKLLNEDCKNAETVAACFRQGQPGAMIEIIIGAYKEVIRRFRGYNATATVFVHNYDNAWPTGVGLFGPADWLKMPMDTAFVPNQPATLRRDVFKALIKLLHEEQLKLAADPAMGPVVVINSAGTLPEVADPLSPRESMWANELHPTPRGFDLLAQKAFIPAMTPVLTAP